MKPDSYLDELIQPIINLYNQMEAELIIEIAKRFRDYGEVSGALEWQLKKLKELGGLNREAVKIIAKYSKLSEKEVKKVIEKAGLLNLDTAELQRAYEQGIITVNPDTLLESAVFKRTLENSYKQINKTFRLIQTKALDASNKAYINALNQSYLDVASGTYDYQTAIRKAVQSMAQQGIEGATYKRELPDGKTKYINYSIEATVRRDILTAVNQTAIKSVIDTALEIGCEDVEVSKHIGARTGKDPISNHFGWQGKVYSIKGYGKKTTELERKTGYGTIEGLGGVNCRHRIFLFWKGFSKPKTNDYNEEENRRVYELSQQQRKLERDIRKLKKEKLAMQALGDTEAEKSVDIKLKKKFDEINKFCKANGLNRDYSRELVYEQLKS